MTDLSPFINFLETPPLWKDTAFEITQFMFPELDLKEFSPKSFPKNIRLGHQMEHILHQLLAYSKAYEVRVYNLPIRDETRTLGEIDFIVKNRLSKELVHIELTYKFYLLDPTISTPIHQIIGPNRKDSLFHKIEKVKQQQFELLHSPEGIKALKQYNIDHKSIVHQACFKAQLFMPYQSKNNNIGSLNRECIVGFWIDSSEFSTDSFSSFQYYIPSKSAWVLAPHNNVKWKSHQEIMLEVNLKIKVKLAPMVWIKKSTTQFEKCFVVWW